MKDIKTLFIIGYQLNSVCIYFAGHHGEGVPMWINEGLGKAKVYFNEEAAIAEARKYVYPHLHPDTQKILRVYKLTLKEVTGFD